MHKGVISRTAKNRRRLAGKGFCTKDESPKPKFTYIHDTQAVTNEKVNRIFRGIVSYYKLADNIRHFGCRLF